MRTINSKKSLSNLLKKYESGKATPEEKEFIEKYYQGFDTRPSITQSLTEEDRQATHERLLEKINERIGGLEETPVIPLYRKLYIQVASIAAILLLLAIGSYLYLRPNRVNDIAKTNSLSHDLAPGKTGAVLAFEGGKTIILDTAKNGVLGNGVTKTDNNVSVASEVVEYATLTTPKARTQMLELPDGSIAWLNAASSIRFPTKFTGKERVVEITGEVDIKVAHNAAMPFKTIARGQVFEDLGTEFNINAYDDEAVIRTTLLEGSIKTNGIILKPGEQAVFNRSSRIQTVVKDADVEQAMAWKNGLFSFNDKTDLYEVMRQLGRWYDVDIAYEGNIKPMQFGGKITRNCNASEVLKILEYSNVHFRIEGSKIIVTP